MPKWHVHVYQVETMVHLTIDTENIQDARQMALSRSKQFTPGPSDCSRIALAFPIPANNDARLLRDSNSQESS